MAREGGGRFEFGWFGIFGMFLVFTAGSVVIFFLGIYVGKGLQESRLAREERVVRLPVSQGENAAEPAAVAARESESRVPDQLAQAQPAVAATASVNLAVRSAVEPVVTAAPVMAATMAPQPVSSPVPVAPRAVQATPPPIAVRTAAPEALAKAEMPRPSARPGSKAWSVQVNATKDQETADRLVNRLSELGYQAFIVRVRLADETWYRVRVGRFPTMEAATAVVMRLKNEERYSRAFLVNE